MCDFNFSQLECACVYFFFLLNASYYKEYKNGAQFDLVHI